MRSRSGRLARPSGCECTCGARRLYPEAFGYALADLAINNDHTRHRGPIKSPSALALRRRAGLLLSRRWTRRWNLSQARACWNAGGKCPPTLLQSAPLMPGSRGVARRWTAPARARKPLPKGLETASTGRRSQRPDRGRRVRPAADGLSSGIVGPRRRHHPYRAGMVSAMPASVIGRWRSR